MSVRNFFIKRGHLLASIIFIMLFFSYAHAQKPVHTIFEVTKKLGEDQNAVAIIDTLEVWIKVHKSNLLLSSVVCEAYSELLDAYQNTRNFTKAVEMSFEAEEYLNNDGIKPDDKLFYAPTYLINRAWNNYRMSQYIDCINAAEVGILKAKTANDKFSRLGTLYNVHGLCAERLDYYTKAIDSHRKAIALRENVDGERQNLMYSYNNIAIAFQNSGVQDSAEFYFEKRIDMSFDSLLYDPIATIRALTNTSHFYRRSDQHQKAQKVLAKADSIRSVDLHRNNRANTMVDYAYGLLYMDAKQFERSKLYFEKCLDLEIKLDGEDHFDQANTYRNLAWINFYLGSNDIEKTAQKATAIYETRLPSHHSRITAMHELMIDFHHKKGNINEAEPYLKKWGSALNKREVDDVEKLIFGCVRAIQYAWQGNKKAAFDCIKKMEKLTEEIKDLPFPKYCEYLSAASMVNYIFGDYVAARKYILMFYEQINYQPYDPDFVMDQRSDILPDFLNKEFITLREQGKYEMAMANRKAMIKMLNDTYLLHPDEGYHSYAGTYHHRAFEDAIGLVTNEKNQDKLDQERVVFSFMEQSKSIQTRGYLQQSDVDEKEVPETHVPAFDPTTIELSDMQTLLLDHKAIFISYHLGAHYLNVLVVSPNRTYFFKKENLNVVEKNVDELSESLIDFKSDRWIAASRKMYQEVFREIDETFDLSDFNRIYISPDGALNRVPFETLLNDQYIALFDRIPVTYTASATLLNYKLNIFNNRQIFNTSIYAPTYDQPIAQIENENNYISQLVRSGQFALKGAQEESRDIAALTNGSVINGDEANVYRFKENAAKADILHLAMHGFFDSNTPLQSGLIFRGTNEVDQMLHLNEIQDLKLNAKLVSLSACETGNGIYKTSDGVQSIAHAFAKAGVPSSVMSLWKVPDESTKRIMVNFYRYLRNGWPKDMALRHAKRDYLFNEKIPELKHPYYWAGFVLQGDPTALEFVEKGWPRHEAYFILMVLAFIVFAAMIWRNVTSENQGY